MSNQEFERHIEFTLQQQATFDANLARHQQQSTEDWAKQRERNAEVDRQIVQLVASLSILRDAIIGLTHHVERHEQEMADLIERGKETDARLNALMLVVERHISDHK